MNWRKWDIAHLGRAVGALVVIVGIAVAAWSALDLPSGFPKGEAGKFFLGAVLTYAFWGFIVMLVAELANHLTWRDEGSLENSSEEEREARYRVGAPPLVRIEALWRHWNNVNIVQPGQAAGALIVIGGIGLSAWNALDRTRALMNLGNNDAAKLFLTNVLQYVFYGFVVILLAELADRIGPRPDDKTGEMEQAPEAAPQAP